jgi:hypothetical protein
MEDYQSYSGLNNAYWHTGLDIRCELESDNIGAPLHTPVSGEVVRIVRYSSSDLYWSFMVRDDDGFIWQFHHLDHRTFGMRDLPYCAVLCHE